MFTYRHSVGSKSFVIIFLIAVAIMLSPFPGCMVDESVAVAALKKAGYTDVMVTDRANYFVALRGGSKEDSVRFTCRAKNPAGQEVSDIYVFSGWLFKSATIRF